MRQWQREKQMHWVSLAIVAAAAEAVAAVVDNATVWRMQQQRPQLPTVDENVVAAESAQCESVAVAVAVAVAVEEQCEPIVADVVVGFDCSEAKVRTRRLQEQLRLTKSGN